MRLKIGTFVFLDTMDTLEDKVAALHRAGFSACQLGCWEPALFTDENAATIRQLMKTYGVEISAFWCGWKGPCIWNFYEGQLTLGLVSPEYRAMRIQNLCDGADFAKKLGVTDVATHMGFIPENPYDPYFPGFCIAVRQVAEHLKTNGQYLLFETGQETPVTMLRCFEQVGVDNLRIDLDTANLILYGKANPVDALSVFGKYVRNIHTKDGRYPTNGHDLGEETPIGEGMVDFRAFFEKLHELGYDRYVTIEREISGEQQQKDILASREYLRQLIEDIYGEPCA